MKYPKVLTLVLTFIRQRSDPTRVVLYLEIWNPKMYNIVGIRRAGDFTGAQQHLHSGQRAARQGLGRGGRERVRRHRRPSAVASEGQG